LNLGFEYTSSSQYTMDQISVSEVDTVLGQFLTEKN